VKLREGIVISDYLHAIYDYCTIPTKCSADVTCDTVEHLRQVFEINKGV